MSIIKGLKAFEQSLRLAEKSAQRKAQQAINRTLQRTRTQATRIIGEELNLQKKIIRNEISIQKANKHTGLIGKLIIQGKPIPLIAFKAKQNRTGVMTKIFKTRARQQLKHGFISPNRHGKQTVFLRDHKKKAYGIKPIFGPSVAGVAKKDKKKIRVFAEKFLQKEFTRLLLLK